VSGNARRSRRQPTPSATSWDHVADWYDGWVGPRGSRYHRLLAVPAALELLEVRPGERILDVGAGQGALAPAIAQLGGRYTGIDVSARLIELARRRHGHEGRFAVADARSLPSVRALGGPFDAAVFLLSIQDMDPLDAVVGSVASVLRPTSRIVMLMTHPAFRPPRHSGWGVDPSRKLTYRRIDGYLTPMAVPLRPVDGRATTRSFHRPLSAYVRALADVGFLVDSMLELPDLPAADRPGAARPENADIPLFLALRARGVSRPSG
jgi:ubiquinone/menaquinone biosynthesis C-methylase UbiE